MEPYQERVIVERVELDDKLSRLRAFMTTESFRGLSQESRDRLVRQERVMTEYSAILKERIAAF